MLAPSGALVVLPWLYNNVGFDPVRDFTPVARVTTFDFAVTAGPGAPAGDLKAMSPGSKPTPARPTTPPRVPGRCRTSPANCWRQETGIPLTHVAYKGGALAAQDLLGGQVPMMVDTASETIEHHLAPAS